VPLEQYRRKRDFSRTPEPAGEKRSRRRPATAADGAAFVVQKHAASRLHYDFRLEMDGVLKSWAVPKGPSLDPHEKRLAVQVEDHPIEYGDFEGVIPPGEYGGGTVLLWDHGTWRSLEGEPLEAWRKGKLKLELQGEKLRGGWTLVRMTGPRAGDNHENWLLIKENDDTARPGSADALVREQVKSAASGQTIEEIAADPPRVWGPDGATELEPAAKRGAGRGKGAAGASSRSSKAKGAAGASSRLAELASAVPGARRAAMPRTVAPELATLVSAPPAGGQWLHEIKFDGYRVVCEVRRGKAQLLTRHGKDWSDRFAPVATAAAALPVDTAILDGEVTVLLPDGKTSFQALQESLGDGGGVNSRGGGAGGRDGAEMVYFVFDLLYLDGDDLRPAPLLERKQALRALLDAAGIGTGSGPIRWSDHVAGQGEDFYRQACRFGLEGIVSKRADLAYRSGRSKDWLKVKCLQRQELVIGGFTDPEGARAGLGALLLGFYEDGRLVYAGKVGTGFTAQVLVDLRRRLERSERQSPPFVDPPRGADARGAHWVQPKLVCEVAFTEWTRDGHLRHPTFQGLREDKPAREVRRELPEPPPAASRGDAGAPHRSSGGAKKAAPAKAVKGARAARTADSKTIAAKATAAKGAVAKSTAATAHVSAPKPRGAVEVAGVRLTHPDKVLYPGRGLTKRDLAQYYERIAGWILPRIANRPLVLVRCPEGQGGECFYQKHLTEQFPDAVLRVAIEEGGKKVQYGAVDSLPGLISLVQMGALELHVWGAHRDQVERPDYAVFDLDPDVGLAWERVVEAALGLRGLLAETGLRSFLKTTGGKGLHVVLPLARRHGWDELKAFTRAVVEGMVASQPDRFTSNPLKARRRGRIFVDYLRNGRGATSIAAYSTRSRPGAPVSTPLAWEELDGDVRADTYTIENLPERLELLAADPWREMSAVKQSITAAMKRRWGVKG
jgi:bifunctional non-homologous end joining protein LigD